MEKKTVAGIPVDIDQKLKEIGDKVKIRRKAISNNYENFAKTYKIHQDLYKKQIYLHPTLLILTILIPY